MISLAAAEPKPVLMLVTGADTMSNGKATGLWLEEFAVPYLALRKAGYPIEVVTPKGGVAPLMRAASRILSRRSDGTMRKNV